jgi:predicted RNase H-like nuclease
MTQFFIPLQEVEGGHSHTAQEGRPLLARRNRFCMYIACILLYSLQPCTGSKWTRNQHSIIPNTTRIPGQSPDCWTTKQLTNAISGIKVPLINHAFRGATAQTYIEQWTQALSHEPMMDTASLARRHVALHPHVVAVDTEERSGLLEHCLVP